MRRFQIDPDITRASTLPGWAYRDADLWKHLVHRVFPTTWQPVPGRCLPNGPGQAAPFKLGNVPLLLSGDLDGELHALSNVCTHRGALMLETPCVGKRIRCPYHGRAFHLDGSLAAMPHFEGAVDFPRPEDDLPRATLATLGPLHFASLAPAQPLGVATARLTELWPYPSSATFGLDRGGDRDLSLSANFALYCDNYLEGFHVPFVHPGLNQALDPSGYRTECLPGAVLQLGMARAGESSFALEPGHPLAGEPLAALYLWLFPNTMVNLYPWGISLNHVEATSPTQCRIRYEAWVMDPSLRNEGAGAGLDAVEQEDQDVVGRVARGIESPLYTHGRYAPSQEAGVHHFHRMLAASLDDPAGWAHTGP
jgi:choline monooxygenase